MNRLLLNLVNSNYAVYFWVAVGVIVEIVVIVALIRRGCGRFIVWYLVLCALAGGVYFLIYLQSTYGIFDQLLQYLKLLGI